MSSFRISCVVPVYNGERFLAEAVDSILAQSLAPFEIIVVDDGSEDGTSAVAARYGPAITYMRQDNAGPAAARNRGVRASSGDLVAFLDADDTWRPGKLALQASRFAARIELDISLAHGSNFWTAEVRHEEEQFRGPRCSVLPAQTMVVRRALFERIGLFDANRMHREVPDWVFQASQRGAVIETLPDVVADRRIHEANRSRGRRTKDAGDLLQMAQALLEKRRGNGPASA